MIFSELIKKYTDEVPPRTCNVHLNPPWRAELKENFQTKVID